MGCPRGTCNRTVRSYNICAVFTQGKEGIHFYVMKGDRRWCLLLQLSACKAGRGTGVVSCLTFTKGCSST